MKATNDYQAMQDAELEKLIAETRKEYGKHAYFPLWRRIVNKVAIAGSALAGAGISLFISDRTFLREQSQQVLGDLARHAITKSEGQRFPLVDLYAEGGVAEINARLPEGVVAAFPCLGCPGCAGMGGCNPRAVPAEIVAVDDTHLNPLTDAKLAEVRHKGVYRLDGAAPEVTREGVTATLEEILARKNKKVDWSRVNQDVAFVKKGAMFASVASIGVGVAVAARVQQYLEGRHSDHAKEIAEKIEAMEREMEKRGYAAKLLAGRVAGSGAVGR